MDKKTFITTFNKSFPSGLKIIDVVWRKVESGYALVLLYEDNVEAILGTYATKSTATMKTVLQRFYEFVKRAPHP